MKIEIIRHDTLIAGPMEFDAARVRDIISRQGGDYRLVPNGVTEALNIGSIAVLPVKRERPAINTRTESYGTPERQASGSEVVYTYPIKARDVEDIRTELSGELAAYHEAQDKGRFEHQGVLIANDLEARINAKGVLDELEGGTLTQTYWRGRAIRDPETGEKGPSRIPVSSTAEMKVIYNAIFGRLNACFAAREAVDEMLATATDAELATFDVRAEFDAITEAAMTA